MANPTVDNGDLDDYEVATDDTPNSGKVQRFREQHVTYTHTRVSIPDNTSTELVAANTSRKVGAYVINNSAVTCWLEYAAAAVLSQCAPLYPGGRFDINTQQQIRAIQNSGGAIYLDLFETS